MAISGRDQLAVRLRQAWARTQRGQGRVVALLGDAGMGKSTVLRWLATDIGAPAVVLAGHGGPLAPPMGLASQLAAVLDPDGPGAAVIADTVDPIAVGAILCDLLQAAAGRAPLAVLVEDLHDIDASSRTALNLALRRVRAPHLLVVATGRHQEPVRAFAEGFTVMEVPPLDDAHASALLRAASPVPIADAVLRRLLDVALGNPLALTHLPASLERDHLVGRRILPDPIPLSGDLRAVFTRPIAILSRPARTLLEVAAVSGDPTWVAICQALDTPPAPALAELEDAGLVRIVDGRVVFSHPLLPDAAASEMSAERLRWVHHRLAAAPVLPRELRLLHRAHAALEPDDDLVDELVSTSQAMRRRGGAEAAARLLDRAVDLTATPDRRAVLQIEAAEVLATAGATAPARRRLKAVLEESGVPAVVVAATASLARLDALHGDPIGAWQRLVACIESAPEHLSGVLHATMAIPLGMLGLVPEILHHATEATAHEQEGSTAHTGASVIRAHAIAALDETGVAAAVSAVLPAVDLDAAIRHDAQFGLHLGRALVIAELTGEAERVLTALTHRSRGETARGSLAMSFGSLGELYVRTCRFGAAAASLDEAVALSFATDQRAFAPFWLALRARVAGIQGDSVRADADLGAGLAIAEELSLPGARYFLKAAAGLVAAVRGDHATAITHLEECRFFEEAAGVLSPNLARWRPDLIEAYVALGRTADARAVFEPMQAVARDPAASRWTRATAHRCDALLVAADDPQRALHALDLSLVVYDPARDHHLDRGRTLALRGRLLQATGAVAAAATALSQARFAFRSIGAAPLVAAIDPPPPVGTPIPIPTTVDQRPPAPPGESGRFPDLSEAEHRVLAAVSTGMTNQQIASQLLVSPKTIANHLSRIYQKMGVASRTEAAHAYLTG